MTNNESTQDWVFCESGSGGFYIKDKYGAVMACLDPENGQLDVFARVYFEEYDEDQCDEDEHAEMAYAEFEREILPDWEGYDFSWNDSGVDSVPEAEGRRHFVEFTGTCRVPDFQEFFRMLRKLRPTRLYTTVYS